MRWVSLGLISRAGDSEDRPSMLKPDTKEPREISRWPAEVSAPFRAVDMHMGNGIWSLAVSTLDHDFPDLIRLEAD